ncbi:MAG TPA: glycosyl transferase [Lachnospiraceae bacterium]|nr:macrolide family glycosyltransferase [uncultured Lachnoclostridium sp.]HAU86136.1 glycosyl transferase [Lachnospiraceae bacterium]
MSTVLAISGAAYGHVTPTLGIIEELVSRGERVLYFCTEEFKAPIEKAGAEFRKMKQQEIQPRMGNGITKDNILFDIAIRTFISYDEVIQDILTQIKDDKIDYILFDSMFAVGRMLADILKVPSVSSFAVFATEEEMKEDDNFVGMEYMEEHPDMQKYKEVVEKFKKEYKIEVPELTKLLYNHGDLNLAYTSEYFLPDKSLYDESFKFIGGPQSIIKKEVDFPFEKLKDKVVVYISLGTAFNGMYKGIYQVFFDALGKEDIVVVLSAYHIGVSEFDIPDNFIVKEFVPQWEVLQYASAAITHGGLSTTSDLVYYNVPFLTLPIGGDQPYMAKCFERLGATIILDKSNLTAELVRESVMKVINEPQYAENIQKIKESFKQAGGRKAAADAILDMIHNMNI